jgi:hypothetical protein
MNSPSWHLKSIAMIAPFLLIFLVAVGAFFLLVLVLVGLGLLGAGFEAIEKLPFLKRKREARRADDEHRAESRAKRRLP